MVTNAQEVLADITTVVVAAARSATVDESYIPGPVRRTQSPVGAAACRRCAPRLADSAAAALWIPPSQSGRPPSAAGSSKVWSTRRPCVSNGCGTSASSASWPTCPTQLAGPAEWRTQPWRRARKGSEADVDALGATPRHRGVPGSLLGRPRPLPRTARGRGLGRRGATDPPLPGPAGLRRWPPALVAGHAVAIEP